MFNKSGYNIEILGQAKNQQLHVIIQSNSIGNILQKRQLKIDNKVKRRHYFVKNKTVIDQGYQYAKKIIKQKK